MLFISDLTMLKRIMIDKSIDGDVATLHPCRCFELDESISNCKELNSSCLFETNRSKCSILDNKL